MTKVFVPVLLTMVFLASSWALFQPELFYVHDFLHAARIAEMARGLSDLHIPVRWSQNFGYGYGMPLFQFYAPLPYFFGALLYLGGFSIITAVKALFLLATLGTVLGSYALGKQLFNRAGGLVLAAVYTLAPYRAVNLFVRGAISEAWGMLWLPWILFAGVRFVQQQTLVRWILLTSTIAALVLSHNLTAVLFLPLSAVFILVYQVLQVKKQSIRWAQQLKIAAAVGGAYVFAAALSAFYAIPAFLEKGYTQVESVIVGGYFDYAVHFVGIRQLFSDTFGYGGSSWGPYDEISFFVGWGTVLGVGISLLAAGISLLKSKKYSKNHLLLFSAFSLGGVALFMTHSRSLPVWELFSFLRFVQFPWRWLSVAGVFFALVSAGFVWFIRTKRIKSGVVIALMLVSLISALKMFKPSGYLADSSEYYFSDAARIRSEFSQVLPDYIPVDFTIESAVGVDQIMLEAADIESIEVVSNKTQYKEARLVVSQPTQVVFAIADYPGWQVQLNGIPVEKVTTKEGALALEVPAGSHVVSARFTSTLVRAVSDWVSALSLVAISLATIMHYRRSRWQK